MSPDVREHRVPVVPPAALVCDIHAVATDDVSSAFEAFDLKTEAKKVLIAGGATSVQAELILEGLSDMGDQLTELVRPGGKGDPDMSKLFENADVQQAMEDVGVDVKNVQAKAGEYVFDDDTDTDEDKHNAVGHKAVVIGLGFLAFFAITSVVLCFLLCKKSSKAVAPNPALHRTPAY